MPTPLVITRTHFEAVLTPPTLRTMAIMQTALAFAPLLYIFPFIVLFGNRNTIPPGRDELFLINILSAVHCTSLVIAAFVGTFLFQRTFSSDRFGNMPDATPENLASRAIGLLRTAIILRLALFEGAAFLGISVCILAMMNGVLEAQPVYWLNLGSLAVFVVFAMQTFPTKERLTVWFEQMLARSQ